MSSCVKEKEYGWCKGEETYRPAFTWFYCIFHLPKGATEKHSPLLKDRIFQKITDAKAKGEICNLSGTIFNEDMSFSIFNKDNPLPEIDFSHAVFCGEVDFREVVFEGSVVFEWATFERDAYFNSAVFKKKADFSASVFKAGAFFAMAKFEDKADFSEITFEGEAYFVKKTFLKDADFNTAGPKGLIDFEEVDLGRVSLLGCDLRKINFTNCTYAKLNSNTRVLYDELVAEKQKDKIERVEILYRRLKQKYLDEHDYGQASEWHVREKEMWRKRTPPKQFIPFIFLWLYKISSGYGEKPGKAFVVLFLMILATAASLYFCGMRKIGAQPAENQINPFKIILSVLQYLTFQKDIPLKPINDWGECIKVVSQILIPLQAALFGLAVRNRFRR